MSLKLTRIILTGFNYEGIISLQIIYLPSDEFTFEIYLYIYVISIKRCGVDDILINLPVCFKLD